MTGSEIDNVLSTYSSDVRNKLESIRALIHTTANSIDEVSGIEECLKWKQPSFVAKPKGLGSTVRIDKRGEGASIYFICTTGLVDRFRDIYPDTFNYIGNREIHFALNDDLHDDALSHCIAMALTYHSNKKQKQ